MRMIPSTPYETKSNAEYKVFDRLTAAFRQRPELCLSAFHSLNLTQHPTKRFGEVDFVIVGRPGLFVLEVKGGMIQCHDGVWTSTGKYGANKIQHPFKQAEGGLQALLSFLREHLDQNTWSRLYVGYGAVFPDCDFRVISEEWTEEMVADRRRSNNLEHWLEALFAHWQARDPNRRRLQLTDEQIKHIKRLLRPSFETALPLHLQVGDIHRRCESLTEDQIGLVDTVEDNDRVLCAGGAGTGKTFLALEFARRWAAGGRQVLVACASPWQAPWLRRQFKARNVAVSLAGSARREARRLGIGHFDALIVDEGQDLLNLDVLDGLDEVLCGGLADGRWCFFHDLNNQSGLIGAIDEDALELLLSYRPAKYRLKKNCRNTRQVLELVKARLGADMGVEGTGDGPEVRLLNPTDDRAAVHALADELGRLIRHGRLHPGSVTVLSPLGFNESIASRLSKPWADELQVLNDYAMRSFPGDKISFARVPEFKGLENEAIIVVDLPQRPSGTPDAAAYVAMSRPRVLLTVIHKP